MKELEAYWVILADDGRYYELTGTEEYVRNWMRETYPEKKYRLVKWED